MQSIEQVLFELKNDKRLKDVKIGADAHDVLSVFGKPDKPFQPNMMITERGFQGYIAVGTYYLVKKDKFVGYMEVICSVTPKQAGVVNGTTKFIPGYLDKIINIEIGIKEFE